MPPWSHGPRVRTARESDAHALADLHVRAWRVAYRGLMPDSILDGLSISERESTWRRVLARHPAQPERVVLVVEEHGTLAGFCSAGPPRDRDLPEGSAELYAIYVEPGLVGTGLGRILLAHAEEDLLSRGYLLAVLWVLDGNARARRFYERAGWETDGASKTEEVEGAMQTEVRYRKEVRVARWASPPSTPGGDRAGPPLPVPGV